MNDLLHMQLFLLNCPCCFGRMADDPPPPPYMAAMAQQFELNRQQFELNRQFMTGVMAQFPTLNAQQQPAPVTLQEFVRLNPSVFRNSANPMDADDWLRDILFEMESASVAPDSYVTFAAFHLKGPAAQWWESHKRMLPAETVITWLEFQSAFRARHIPRGLID